MGAAAANSENSGALLVPAGEERGAVQGGVRGGPVPERPGAARYECEGDAGDGESG